MRSWTQCGFVLRRCFPLHFSRLLLFLIFYVGEATNTFTVYRIQHFDIQGIHYGSRGSPLDCEAQSLSTRLLPRKCIIISLSDTTLDVIKNAVLQNVAGIVITLPTGKWTVELQAHFSELEQDFLSNEFPFPIYITMENDRLLSIRHELSRISSSDFKGGSLSAISSILLSTGYRVLLQSTPPKILKDAHISNIEGILKTQSEEKLPMIVVCAHYDALTGIPGFSHGADANGSGVAVLLELARIFSRIFSALSSRPRFDLTFVLTSGAKFNYLGAKRWLDKNIEDASGLAMLDSVSQVICLEGLGSAQYGQDLFAHSSRPSKDGSLSQQFLQAMNTAIDVEAGDTSNATVQWVHKKINLNQEVLSWEHERFAINRLPSLTLSAWPTVQEANRLRRSSLDGGPLYHTAMFGNAPMNRSTLRGTVDPAQLTRNTRVIADALARIVFDMEGGAETSTIIDPKWISEKSITSVLDLLVNRPRSLQLLSSGKPKKSDNNGRAGTNSKSSPEKSPDLVDSLEHLMSSLLPHVRLHRHPLSGDGQGSRTERDSESNADQAGSNADGASSKGSILSMAAAVADYDVVLYSGVEPKSLMIYSLKSSMFDLLIAVSIGSYLGVMYLVLEHASRIQLLLASVRRSSKSYAL